MLTALRRRNVVVRVSSSSSPRNVLDRVAAKCKLVAVAVRETAAVERARAVKERAAGCDGDNLVEQVDRTVKNYRMIADYNQRPSEF